MTYDQTIDFLYNHLPVFHRVGKSAYKADLKNTITLDDYFNHPHKKFKTIHIAGTNGKGSVSHMLASVFQEAGYKTGLYTPPHLKSFRERIKINGEMIEENKVASFVENHRSIIEAVVPSFFEITVAMAFDYFAENNIDIAIVEVGLGGRLDSTNIITPVLSVITNIGHDHLDLLGPGLENVSFEKAGIIKHQVPVVIGESQSFSEKIFFDKAKEMQSTIFFADKNYKCIPGSFNVETGFRELEILNTFKKTTIKVETPLGGNYQTKNIATVVQSYEILRSKFSLKEQDLTIGISKVLHNTGLMGRWQILGRNPLIICDTGHNKEGLEYVIEQIKSMKKSNLHIVIGFVNDKDLSSVLPLFPHDAFYYFTKALIPRALNENILKTEALKHNLSGEAYPVVKEALDAAIKNSGPDDLIFIGGSTYIVAEVI